jgi:hypothetical protein
MGASNHLVDFDTSLFRTSSCWLGGSFFRRVSHFPSASPQQGSPNARLTGPDQANDAKRRRRLSSITRAPCRKVMGIPGQRSHAAR